MDITVAEDFVGMAKDSSKILYFNELTVSPSCPDMESANERAKIYLETLKAASDDWAKSKVLVRYKTGIHSVMPNDTTFLYKLCLMNSGKDWVRLIMFMTDQKSFDVEIQEDVSVTVEGKEKTSWGLSKAYSDKTAVVGFDSGPCWHN